ncbi:Erythronate-4-phosphate dehydrogenase family [Olea europaea subsp. europaea]|uniref:Erythronate-4-phosphate dehydrogenase family n=1 Tax=Olea europaea subsp. europaea TaxID=158383 RepID=A0A8S0Q8V6_OLEEU|nr:Erythronate-4-phosphate dehydrogenase family [Olea europaea subsp. europaea]
MENSHVSHGNGNLADPGLQIKKHSLYQSGGKYSLPWFDIRVFYVRVSNFKVDESTPESLTLNHIPLGPDTLLEVNGVRCSIDSEGVSCLLRRDRVDKTFEEVTFVSTDGIRLTGSVKFEVFNREDLVLFGVLEMPSTNGFLGDSNNTAHKWSMDCESVMSPGTGFLKGKQIKSAELFSPTIEVYVAGSFLRTPVILTKTLQLKHRKKHRKGTLGSIPENETAESNRDVASGLDLQVAEYRNYKPENDGVYDNSYWRRTEYVEGEDGELTWFNAGVRVGVGIGLGICLGVGIGAGLLVRTYQTASRNFKRRLW